MQKNRFSFVCVRLCAIADARKRDVKPHTPQACCPFLADPELTMGTRSLVPLSVGTAPPSDTSASPAASITNAGTTSLPQDTLRATTMPTGNGCSGTTPRTPLKPGLHGQGPTG